MSDADGGTAGTEETAPPQGGEETAPPQGGGAMKRVTDFMMSNKIEALLWATRVVTIFSAFSFFLPIFGGNPYSAYQRALLASAATSALRVHQRMPNFQFSREYLGRLFQEDSAHYLFYSLIFLYSSPVTMVLVPIFLFGLLHAQSYTKKILNEIGPNSIQFVRNLLAKIEAHQVNILRFIACNEIFLMPAIVFMIFTGQASFVLPFIYYRFLTLRYASRRNPYCRQLFYELRITTEQLCASPRCPGMVRNLCFKAIAFITRLAPPVQAQ